MMEELHKDREQLEERYFRFLDNGGIRHLKRPNAKFPAYVTTEIKTKRGNRYICYFLFRKRGEVFNQKALFSYDALMETKEGLACVQIAYSMKHQREILYIYRPHVFKRYKERIGLELEGIELIKYFHNRCCNTILHDNYKHKEGDMENDLMLTVTDGALFGTKSDIDGCVCYTINTFIANDTMQDGYKSKFNSRHNEAIEESKDDYLYMLNCKNTKYRFDYIMKRE